MLARASFLPTLAYNVVMERVSTRRWWDRMDQKVVLGALPFKGATSQRVRKMEPLSAHTASQIEQVFPPGGVYFGLLIIRSLIFTL